MARPWEWAAGADAIRVQPAPAARGLGPRSLLGPLPARAGRACLPGNKLGGRAGGLAGRGPCETRWTWPPSAPLVAHPEATWGGRCGGSLLPGPGVPGACAPRLRAEPPEEAGSEALQAGAAESSGGPTAPGRVLVASLRGGCWHVSAWEPPEPRGPAGCRQGRLPGGGGLHPWTLGGGRVRQPSPPLLTRPRRGSCCSEPRFNPPLFTGVFPDHPTEPSLPWEQACPPRLQEA